MTDLSHWEQVALVVSVTFKWYHRYWEATMVTGIGRPDWRAALKSLKAKGLLDSYSTPTASGMEWARGKRLDELGPRKYGGYIERKVPNVT